MRAPIHLALTITLAIILALILITKTEASPSPESYHELTLADGSVVGFWAEDDFGVVVPAVIECESRGWPTARNPLSGAVGLTQFYWDWNLERFVNSWGYSWDDLTNPEIHMFLAHEWWKATGRRWGPWLSSYGCWAPKVGW